MPKETKDALDAPVTPGLDGVDDVKKEKPASKPAEEKVDGVSVAEAQALLEAINKKTADRDHWKREYGNRSNEVGDLRKQVKSLEELIRKQGRNSSSNYDSDFVESDSINRSDMKRMMNEVYQENINSQNQAQDDINARWQSAFAHVSSRPGYEKIAEDLEKAAKDPRFQQDFINGRDSADALFDRTMVKRLSETMAKLIEENTGSEANAKLEPNSSARVAGDVTPDDERKEKIRKAKEKKDLKGGLAAILEGM